ncbi:hypothetical protein [Streptomyces sp. NPDC092307]|uniref:hypothetical protein n=1 Tax=Streptomyces sp. NPDC092307 TaxID=3366013 RepID=UPI0038017420
MKVSAGLERRIDKVSDEVDGLLEAAAELIESIRCSTDAPVPGVGECFAHVFFSLSAKMTELDVLRRIAAASRETGD